jgi:hypothetical protein
MIAISRTLLLSDIETMKLEFAANLQSRGTHCQDHHRHSKRIRLDTLVGCSNYIHSQCLLCKFILSEHMSMQAKPGGYSLVARCSPSLLKSFIKTAVTDPMRITIEGMGFKGILSIAARSLDNRDFISWLMDRFDPETMTIDTGGCKKLQITEYAIKCVLDLPSDGVDPPLLPKDCPRQALTQVAARLLPDEPEPKSVKMSTSKVAETIFKYRTAGDSELDEDFCTRLFFMVVNNILLTPNTFAYLRNVDAHWCQDLQAIAGYNWCKIVLDNLREAGRKWKLNRQLKLGKPPILGCSIFLIVSSSIPIHV